MKVSLFKYHLPKNRIAQTPASPRDHARLFVLDKKAGRCAHKHIYDLPNLLRSGDILVLNNSKVIPARLYARKVLEVGGGGRVELFLLKHAGGRIWHVLLKGQNLRPQTRLTLLPTKTIFCTILRREQDGATLVEFSDSRAAVHAFYAAHGETPLPPYIKASGKSARVKSHYQTIFAKTSGSVAAPTAGLHFTKNLLRAIATKGVQIEYVTLHVGLGTFEPIRTAYIEDHAMHAEYAEIDRETLKRLLRAKTERRRMVAVGTTSARILEGLVAPYLSTPYPKKDKISAELTTYIYPPYAFKMVDALLTNFHLPQSSLLVFVAAFTGRSAILRAYQKAIRAGYRFYSFGDAMFIH